MKKTILFAFFCSLIFAVAAQNQIRAKVGYTSSYTAIAEYIQPDNSYYLLESVELDKYSSGVYAGLEVDIDLGKRFFLVTGFDFSQRGLSKISFTDAFGYSASKSAFQNYVGVNFRLKYHYVFKDSKWGLFLAIGPKIDFAVGGPNYAEYSTVYGHEYFQSFGTFNTVEFLLYTNLGVSYKAGPGEIALDLILMNGLSDAIRNKYVVGNSYSLGITAGYSFYLN